MRATRANSECPVTPRGVLGRYHRAMTALEAGNADAVPLRAGGRIAIRPLTPADVRTVRRLERAAYGPDSPRTAFERELRNGLAAYLVAADASTPVANPPVPSPPPPRPLRWLRRLLGAHEGPPILGFAGAWYTHEQLHLVTIAVDPAAQRRGIGLALVLAVCELAIEAELDSVALEVRASNAVAMRLYERCGFRRAGRLRNYYSNNREDAIVMLLDGLTAPEPPEALTHARLGLAGPDREAGAETGAED